MKTESFTCRACGRPAELGDLVQYPFACRRCVSKYFDKMVAAQAESIKFWQETSRNPPARRQDADTGARARWSESIRRGLESLGL